MLNLYEPVILFCRNAYSGGVGHIIIKCRYLFTAGFIGCREHGAVVPVV